MKFKKKILSIANEKVKALVFNNLDISTVAANYTKK